MATGHPCAAISNIFFCLSSYRSGNCKLTTTSATRRGLGAITLVTSHLVPSILILCVRAAIAMVVNMQLANDSANKSVGENASPLPWLSVGASVNILVPDCKCVASGVNRLNKLLE